MASPYDFLLFNSDHVAQRQLQRLATVAGTACLTYENDKKQRIVCATSTRIVCYGVIEVLLGVVDLDRFGGVHDDQISMVVTFIDANAINGRAPNEQDGPWQPNLVKVIHIDRFAKAYHSNHPFFQPLVKAGFRLFTSETCKGVLRVVKSIPGTPTIVLEGSKAFRDLQEWNLYIDKFPFHGFGSFVNAQKGAKAYVELRVLEKTQSDIAFDIKRTRSVLQHFGM